MRWLSPAENSGDKGFVLIFAIAACLLLAVIGLTVNRSVQSALGGTRTAIALAKARALADGGVALAVQRLQAGIETRPLLCSIAGAGLVAITIEDEAGKVSLNSNNVELLTALFEGLGATPDDARRYVAAISDYRDSDDRVQPGGAEREAYAAAGLTFGPKNADFQSVAELDRVLGIPAGIRAFAKPHLTTATVALGVDATVASVDLLQLLAGSAPLSGGSAPFGDRPALRSAFSAASTRSFYKIRSIGIVDGARYLRETVIARPQRPGESLRHINWLQGEINRSDEVLLATADAPPPC